MVTININDATSYCIHCTNDRWYGRVTGGELLLLWFASSVVNSAVNWWWGIVRALKGSSSFVSMYTSSRALSILRPTVTSNKVYTVQCWRTNFKKMGLEQYWCNFSTFSLVFQRLATPPASTLPVVSSTVSNRFNELRAYAINVSHTWITIRKG